jgi:hypothetical protein
MAVTSKHVEPESAALRGIIPEGPLCFHRACRVTGKAGASVRTASVEEGQAIVGVDVPG